MQQVVVVTGGAGFIGSAVVRHLIHNTDNTVVNVDKLTYAGNLSTLDEVARSDRYFFEEKDIADAAAMERIFREYRPAAVMHLAAESHVDRSIDRPDAFVQTNVVGTYNLLETARAYWRGLDSGRKEQFRFLHVSTDEVFGSLGATGFFIEETPYSPRSPYSATKAASDHLVRSWGHTFELPVLVTNCSNNYGPYQYPEKLIPVIILKALQNEPIPVYGKGQNVRDWLYVEDHVRALDLVVRQGRIGETYNIGGRSEKTNLEVVQTVCSILDGLRPRASGGSYADRISFVQDRPGHDFRYAIDASKIERELGWKPQETFETGIRKTIEWYLNNLEWCEEVRAGKYNLERLGQV